MTLIGMSGMEEQSIAMSKAKSIAMNTGANIIVQNMK